MSHKKTETTDPWHSTKLAEDTGRGAFYAVDGASGAITAKTCTACLTSHEDPDSDGVCTAKTVCGNGIKEGFLPYSSFILTS